MAIAAAVAWQLAGGSSTATPEWAWIGAVLLVDVAHVWATAFRVYFVPAEWRRRPWLYFATPVLSYAIAVALYSEGQMLFWRALAYLAVFHFVRQQYGWVALYRRRLNEVDRLGWWVDSLAIYLATLGPLAYWHAHLPRSFWWFMPGDFAAAPKIVGVIFVAASWLALLAYAVRSLRRWRSHREWNPGKDLVVVSTFACWHLGIVVLNSDFAFAATNVLIHGIPYLVLVYWHRWERTGAVIARAGRGRAALLFLATVWGLAYAEELLWDRAVWHERPWLFGAGWAVDEWETWLVPLLAAPQITHYILDAFLWRRGEVRMDHSRANAGV